jgi:hypothetical protein
MQLWLSRFYWYVFLLFFIIMTAGGGRHFFSFCCISFYFFRQHKTSSPGSLPLLLYYTYVRGTCRFVAALFSHTFSNLSPKPRSTIERPRHITINNIKTIYRPASPNTNTSTQTHTHLQRENTTNNYKKEACPMICVHAVLQGN